MPKKLPAFTVECTYAADSCKHSRFVVNWTDGDRRYHVWLEGEDNHLGKTIHSNPVKPMEADRHRPAHRALDAKSAKHRPMMDAIRAALEDGTLLDAAWTKAVATEAAQKAEHRRQLAETYRVGVLHYADRLQLEGAGQIAADLRGMVERMNDDQVIDLGYSLR